MFHRLPATLRKPTASTSRELRLFRLDAVSSVGLLDLLDLLKHVTSLELAERWNVEQVLNSSFVQVLWRNMID